MSNKHHSSLPHVDVIILNYNGERHLDKCISSLEQTDYPDFSIILIDNNSIDNSLDLVRKKYPRVTIIHHKENLGFGKAYDLAFHSSGSDFFALLNNDTQADPNWLNPLVNAMLADKNLAAASAKLLFMEHPQVINHAGGGMNSIGIGFDMGMFEPDGKSYALPKEVFFPSGAACLMRRSAYEKSGGFDPEFFMYHEDVDLGWRFRLYGYKVVCIPESIVYHVFGGSSLKISGMTFRNNLGYRHALRSLIKNYERKNLVKTLPKLMAIGFRAYLRDGSINFPKCLLWNVYNILSTLKNRIRIQKNRTKTDAQMAHYIWPHLQLPVYFPDYSIQSMDSFVNSGNKNESIPMNEKMTGNLGYGWYAPDRLNSPGLFYRWSRSEAVCYLWMESVPVKIILQALALARSLGRTRTFHFYIRNERIKTISINSDEIEFIELDYSGPAGPLEIKVSCEDTWTPDAHYQNQDHRNLGLGVVRVASRPVSFDQRPYSGISVIIPTYNRYECLEKVLTALEKQTLPLDSFEVIVVDDGSTDETMDAVTRFMSASSMHLKYIKQENKKQGAARNNGLSYANMPLIAFIGDDIIPAPDFLKAHLCRHNHENIDDKLAVTGHTKWSDELKITPFMEYIHEYGYQFGYSIMEDINDLPFNFFYTSNISLSKQFLFKQDMIFDENFETYGWEDIELGYRLKKEGMRLCFEHRAIAFHNHPIDFSSFCRRQFNVGKSSRSFLKKHPELKVLLGDKDLDKWVRYRLPAAILAKLVNRLDHRNIGLPRRIYNFILLTFYCLGAKSGDRKKP